MVKLNILKLQKMKLDKIPVAWVTAYDYPLAFAAEQAGVDMILVGDSGGMCQLGYPTTNPVTMDEMIILAKAVRRGAPNTFVIGDMPQGSYEPSDEIAILNALRFIKEAGCDAVKCEGGQRMVPRVKAMVDAGIPVMGHLGLTPQSTQTFGGYRVQGKTAVSLGGILKDAKALQAVGAFSILLEAMPNLSSKFIAKELLIPIYSVGAGLDVDGQLLIIHDLLGLYPQFRPLFAKCYIPQVIKAFTKLVSGYGMIQKGREERMDGFLQLAILAIKAYIDEVKQRLFPSTEFIYPLNELESIEIQTFTGESL